ncbi:multiubiquitin domain-containing protein [Zunongwangia atlantica]|uniref:Multi-ubiquitin domain-containing protein n=1 Tax=Zunongwangia atlantica 22II14-10F7 TaxID=1185767 RepID=A0A1Y1T3W4_9FLAO|nr:multiubiquitin domain-containing protein [Zunongwangia atlantica]ORL45265.1 hypothetical protein IIF7_12457 [Zunongwangia atlantica 22II14-10F7]
MYFFKINNKKFESNESELTGRDLLNRANLKPVEDYELLYKINEKGFTPIQLNEVIDLKSAGIEGFRALPYKPIRIKINDIEIEVEESFMTPLEIMKLAEIDSDKQFLMETRNGGMEVTYKDDVEHKIAITKHSVFKSIKIDRKIEFVIVEGDPKAWSKETISFDEVVMLEYGSISKNPNVIYTVNYFNGVPSKPEGSMVKGDVISVKNKMIFNVGCTDKS